MNMQNDDEKVERLLKRFQPRALKPLQIETRPPGVRRPFLYVLATAVVVVAAVLPVTLRHPQPVTPGDVPQQADVERLSNPEPLTLGEANDLISRAPSMKAAIDDMTFKPQSTQLTNGQHSALTVLGKEKIQL